MKKVNWAPGSVAPINFRHKSPSIAREKLADPIPEQSVGCRSINAARGGRPKGPSPPGNFRRARVGGAALSVVRAALATMRTAGSRQ